ncbi:MAG: site-specific DNA-methyltransferase [Pseudomonadota bacterium]
MTVSIITGDCQEVLATLPAKHFHTCVTSPPYYGLRDYGVDGQIGLEASPAAFIDQMVAVFREVHRVLRDDGTLWLNLGDSYCSNGGPGWQGKNGQRSDRRFTATRNTVGMRTASRCAREHYKPKDLMGMPWRVAFALQEDGWYLRQDIIWAKPNPMPESVRDRCTKAHEYIFLLSKSPKYAFDADAINEPVSPNTHARLSQDVIAQIASARAHGGTKTMKAVGRTPKAKKAGFKVKNNESFGAATAMPVHRRNKRSVWTVGSDSYLGAHFSTYPPALIEPCILAGSPEGGHVLDPFGGAGTTGLVADRLGRNATLIELNSEYATMARDRVLGDAPLLTDVSEGGS